MAGIQEKASGLLSRLERGAKIALAGAALFVVLGVSWGVYLLVHDDYRPLFTQLSDTDAASIVDALKRQKVPYKLSDDGTSILVPADRVHETRLQLMSSDVPLSGGVGFEIFDKQGLGATEESQRVSYQRALQGELARTIGALENVKHARVHLVLPEATLFKRDRQKATASVVLTLVDGMHLDQRRIVGVQRLVAAAVAGLKPANVIVTDQRGVTLSASDPESGTTGGFEARFGLQREVESYISQKISHLLDKALGPGQAIISVAVVLNFDATKTTTQDLIPVRGSTDSGVVRKRQTIAGAGGASGAEKADASTATRRSNSTLEVDYEYGHRVEEVIAAPGAVKRMTVGIVVPPQFSEEQIQRITQIVQVAAGIDAARGDVLSIQALPHPDGAHPPTKAQGTIDEAGNASALAGDTDSGSAAGGDGNGGNSRQSPTHTDRWLDLDKVSRGQAVVALILVLFVGAVIGLLLRGSASKQLTPQQREQLLRDIRNALGEDGRVTHLQAKQ